MDSRDITLERIEKLISSTYWTDCNLFGKLWRLRTGDGVQVRIRPCSAAPAPPLIAPAPSGGGMRYPGPREAVI